MNIVKKVIELIRVSTDQQAANDRASIPAQRAVNARTCSQYGLEIVRTIEVTDVSGACVLTAPEIQELVRLMQTPEIHGVVTREFSRLMRPENFADYALLQSFVDSKTVLYLPEGPIDLTSKSGRFMGALRAAMAGMDRTDILERVWSAKEVKRKRGELAQSQIVLPFAVGYEPGRGFYYKPEAERVREAFRLFLAGNQNYQKLARLVGVTPRGMHIILRNPIWTGWRVIDKKRDASAAGRYPTVNKRQADRRKVKRAPEQVIRVQVIAEPLVSEAEFKAVQQIMDRKQSRHWRCQVNVERRFTYNSFLTCSSCGEVVHRPFGPFSVLRRRHISPQDAPRLGCETTHLESRRSATRLQSPQPDWPSKRFATNRHEPSLCTPRKIPAARHYTSPHGTALLGCTTQHATPRHDQFALPLGCATKHSTPRLHNRAQQHTPALGFTSPHVTGCAEILRLACVLAVERGLGPALCAPHHDALYLECAEEEVPRVAGELEACFRDAGEAVLTGRLQLRLETGIVRYPDRYCDEDGKEIWDMVVGFLGQARVTQPAQPLPTIGLASFRAEAVEPCELPRHRAPGCFHLEPTIVSGEGCCPA